MPTTLGPVVQRSRALAKPATSVSNFLTFGLVFVAAVLAFLLLVAIVTQYGGEEAARIWNWSDVSF